MANQSSTWALLVASAALVVASASAQYPLEECHWECEIVQCDYYGEHCDYDCYEVCYPYARTMAAAQNNRYHRRRQQQQQQQQQPASSIDNGPPESLLLSSSSTSGDSTAAADSKVSSKHRAAGTDQSQIGDKEINDYEPADHQPNVEVSSTSPSSSPFSINRANNNHRQRHHQSSTKRLEFEPPLAARKAPPPTTPVSNGKVVRMRIQNAPQIIRHTLTTTTTTTKEQYKRAPFSYTRCMIPRSFAMFQTCLSSRGIGDSHSNIGEESGSSLRPADPRLSTIVTAGSTNVSPSDTKGGHLVFGTPELSVRAKLH